LASLVRLVLCKEEGRFLTFKFRDTDPSSESDSSVATDKSKTSPSKPAKTSNQKNQPAVSTTTRKSSQQTTKPVASTSSSSAATAKPNSVTFTEPAEPVKKRGQAPKMRPTARHKSTQSSEDSDTEKDGERDKRETTPRKRTRSTIVRKSKLIHGSIGGSDSESEGKFSYHYISGLVGET
jgi:hypothetical protein